MGIGIIGQAQSGATAVLGGKDEVLAGKFSIFGKTTQAIPAGEYVVGATAGSKGNTQFNSKAISSGKQGIALAGQAIIQKYDQQEAGIAFAANSSPNVPESYDYRLNSAVLLDSAAYDSINRNIYASATNGTTSIVVVGYRGDIFNSATFENTYEIWTSGSQGWTRTYQLNTSTNNSNFIVGYTYASYTNNKFIVTLDSDHSSFTDRILESSDGITWTSQDVTDNSRSQMANFSNGTYLTKNTSNVLVSSSDPTGSFTNIETSIAAYLEFWVGSPNSIAVSDDGSEILAFVAGSSATTSVNPDSFFVAYSSNGGATFTYYKGSQISTSNLDYFTNAVYQNGTFYMLCRNQSQGKVSVVSFNGTSWSVTDTNINTTSTFSYPANLFYNGVNWTSTSRSSYAWSIYNTSSNPASGSWTENNGGGAPTYYTINQVAPNRYVASDSSTLYTSSNQNYPSWSSLSLTTIFNSYSGLNFSSNFIAYNSFRSASGVTIVVGRYYDGTQYKGVYLRATADNPSSTSQWVAYDSPLPNVGSYIYGVFYSETNSKWYIVNQQRDVAESSDGLTWTIKQEKAPSLGVYYAAGQQRATKDSSDNFYLLSASTTLGMLDKTSNFDSYESSQNNLYPSSKPVVQHVVPFNDMALIFNNQTFPVLKTTDGTTFTQLSDPINATGNFSRVGDELWVRDNITDTWLKTSDGSTFTSTSLPYEYLHVARIGSKVVATGSTNAEAAYSNDGGVTWTEFSYSDKSSEEVSALLPTDYGISSWYRDINKYYQITNGDYDASEEYGVFYYTSDIENI